MGQADLLQGFCTIAPDIPVCRRIEHEWEERWRYWQQLDQAYQSELLELRDRLQDEMDQRQQTQDTLSFYQQVVEQSSEMILAVRPEGQIIFANEAAVQGYGYPRERLLTLRLADLFDPQTWSQMPNLLESMPPTGTCFETQHQRQDRTVFGVGVKVYAAILNQETVWVWQVRDERDRRQLQEALQESAAKHQALEEATKMQARQFSATLKRLKETQAQMVQSEKMSSLGQLVAGIAHEINNPVNFIYGNLTHASDYTEELMHLIQLYRDAYPYPSDAIRGAIKAMELDFLMDDLPKLLQSMRVGTERIQNIVISLRNFSRMDEAEMKVVDIHEGIESTLMILQNRLKAKPHRAAIAIVKDYGNLPLVECYAGQLNQVFMNLLCNALDALDEGSSTEQAVGENAGWEDQAYQALDPHGFNVAIDTHKPLMIWIQTQVTEGDRVRIRIADNGPGIPQAILGRLFDPFFTTKPVGQGTGLGLAISYQIVVEKHHGDLSCSSIPGQETSFEIEIPLRQLGSGYR